MATQGERRAETRSRLLDSAAGLFAERGIEASSVDTIAALANRTSGAVYDHFGGKEGLLHALLESWAEDVSAVIGAELLAATTLDEQLATLWRNVVDPPSGGTRWIALEHELWSYAARHPEAREYLARRYRAAWSGVDAAAQEWVERDTSGVGAVLIGLLMGLEMMRRIDPEAITDELAIESLRSIVVGAQPGDRPPTTPRSQPAHTTN